MVEPERLMDGLSSEIMSTLQSMQKAKTLDEKMAYSKIVKNLCKSMSVFLNLANDMMGYDTDVFDE
ncbi:MAG: hypothetical protein PHI06_06020 [Desulfobulbaceae bacterium]|nr:hypothetical protein [Desulfobulbaceae bacterium]